MLIAGEDLLNGFYKLFFSRFLFNWSYQKYSALHNIVNVDVRTRQIVKKQYSQISIRRALYKTVISMRLTVNQGTE